MSDINLPPMPMRWGWVQHFAGEDYQVLRGGYFPDCAPVYTGPQMREYATAAVLAERAGFSVRGGTIRTMHSNGSWVGINQELTDAHKELRAAIANATGDDDAAPECTCAAKDMTFGRCCKVTPNATNSADAEGGRLE